jgi:2,5-diketo-D-gluconate reductase A
VRRSFQQTLVNLKLDTLDLFLIHWPLPTRYDGDYVSTWRAVTELVLDGHLSSAGVSNFQPHHLNRIVNETGAVPVINQIELHPSFLNTAADASSRRLGVAVEAWSPLGQGRIVDHHVIRGLAAKHERTAAQVVVRWHVEQGRIAIPKSSHPERIASNLAVFDFELDAGDIAAIDRLNRGEGGRLGPNPDTFDRIP